MAKPNVYTAHPAIDDRLRGDLVSTYASGLWFGAAPQGSLPASDEKPMVLIESEFEPDTALPLDNGELFFNVWCIQHRNATRADLRTLLGRVIGDASTHGLLRWQPTISGVGTSEIGFNGRQEDGPYDPEYVTVGVPFRLYLTEIPA